MAATAESKAKNWKTAFITSTALLVVSIGMHVAGRILANTAPTWDILSVASNVAKVKFGREEINYALIAGGAPLVMNRGKFTLIVTPTYAADNTINGAIGQLYDSDTKSATGSSKTVAQA